MDIGRVVICLFFSIYFINLYRKSRKQPYLLAIFIGLSGMVYGGAYNLYRFFTPTIKVIVDIIYLASFLSLFFIVQRRKR